MFEFLGAMHEFCDAGGEVQACVKSGQGDFKDPFLAYWSLSRLKFLMRYDSKPTKSSKYH